MLARLGVEDSERAVFSWAWLCLLLLGAAAAALVNLSETLFLKRVGVEYLPFALLASSALLVVAAGAFVMQFSRFGRTTYAIGGNEQSALMGLKVARVTVAVYVISGVCGGLAGLVLTAYSGAGYPRYGVGTELDAIAAVVIGGTLLTGGRGYVLGSMIGVFVYGTIKTIISFMGAEQSWMQIIIGGLLLLFIVIQRAIVARSDRRG